MTIFETERLVLREFRRLDAEELALTLCDHENMGFYPLAFGAADVERWIERSRERYLAPPYHAGLWAAILKRDGALIGDCGLLPQLVDGEEELEVGYHLRRSYQGQGYATEAALACRDYGFARFQVDRLISLIRPENIPSRRVAERNGMTVWKETAWAGLPHLVYCVQRAMKTVTPRGFTSM